MPKNNWSFLLIAVWLVMCNHCHCNHTPGSQFTHALKKILLISENIYPGVGWFSSEVALISNDSCNNMQKLQYINNKYIYLKLPPVNGHFPGKSESASFLSPLSIQCGLGNMPVYQTPFTQQWSTPSRSIQLPYLVSNTTNTTRCLFRLPICIHICVLLFV